jgi:hypothetical protein
MKRNSKGHFVKRGSTALATRPKTRTITKTRTKYVARKAKTSRRGKRGAVAGGPKLVHLAIAAGGLAYLFGDKGPQSLVTNANKIPGAKTFGAPATVGLACLAVNHFRPNKYLKAAGIVGLIMAASQVGKQGTDFKFVGDEGDEADFSDDGSDQG